MKVSEYSRNKFQQSGFSAPSMALNKQTVNFQTKKDPLSILSTLLGQFGYQDQEYHDLLALEKNGEKLIDLQSLDDLHNLVALYQYLRNSELQHYGIDPTQVVGQRFEASLQAGHQALLLMRDAPGPKDWWSMIHYQPYRDQFEKDLADEFFKMESRRVGIPCRKCKEKTVNQTTKHFSRPDEPMTFIFKCDSCGEFWSQ